MKRTFLLFLVFILVSLPPDTFSTPDASFIVVLDAGHGGKDPGNLGTGRYSKTEKQIALSVTLKLGDYIKEQLPDVGVVYTRKTDTYPTLWQRVNIANSSKADLFLSIHCDAFTNKNAFGCGSYIMGLDYTDENLRMAQKENSSIFLEDDYEENYDGFDPNSIESVIALTLNQSVYMEKSIQIAQKIQDQFRERVNRKDRGVRQAPYLVTSRTLMPSVLVELGFLTNPKEEDFLQSEKGQTYMASAIYRAVKEYRNDQFLDKVSNSTTEDNPSQNTDSELANTSEETTTENLPDLHFKVQIYSSKNDQKLKPLDEYTVSSYKEGNLHKFTVGNSTTIEQAIMLLNKAKKHGFNDAFIIAFYKGDKISIKEAKQIIKTNE